MEREGNNWKKKERGWNNLAEGPRSKTEQFKKVGLGTSPPPHFIHHVFLHLIAKR